MAVDLLDKQKDQATLEKIRRELSRLDEGQWRLEAGQATESDTSVAFGRVVLVDTTAADVEVRLPTPKPGDQGKMLMVKQLGASNNAKVLAPVGHTLDGETSQSYTAYGGAIIMYCYGKIWVTF